jgi:quercetin dioxygenase-like cupin family protein
MSSTTLTTLLHQVPPFIPDGAEVMTATLELPPGDPGTPPHRHSGPVYGYVTEGAIVWELEGEPERVIRAGEAFWEPGGDVIHYQAGNALTDAWSRFVVVMVHAPGAPMLTLVDEAELAERRHLRAPREVRA